MIGSRQLCISSCRKSVLFKALLELGVLTASCSCPQCSLYCDICGSAQQIELNHPCGRNHVPWFTLPNCQKHHREFHIRLGIAGINLEYTPDENERLRRAKKAWLIYQLMREEYLESNGRKQS